MTRPSDAPARRTVAAVVFDMDGTLIDTSVVVPEAFIAAIRALGGPEYTPAQIIEAYAIGHPAAMLEHLLDRPVAEADVATYNGLLAERLARVQPYPGVEEMVRRLAERVPLGIYTAADASGARMLMGSAGLLPHFAALVGGDEVPNQKPAPDGLVLACRRLGVEPADAAYVGDAWWDMEAARRCGALAVAAGWGQSFDPGLPADFVAEDPGQLLRVLSI